jgi:hypothetical protein
VIHDETIPANLHVSSTINHGAGPVSPDARRDCESRSGTLFGPNPGFSYLQTQIFVSERLDKACKCSIGAFDTRERVGVVSWKYCVCGLPSRKHTAVRLEQTFRPSSHLESVAGFSAAELIYYVLRTLFCSQS